MKIGPYEIIAPVGAGGMGEVYRARDTKLGRDVALKLLPETFALDPERLARFRREAQVLASLNHPNIAAIYGLEESNGQALVLEFVEGETLADRIATSALSLSEALPIARQIAEALEAAHEQGIIHRDLKPANVALKSEERASASDRVIVKVLDFGLAKALEPPGAGAAAINVTASPTITSPAMTQMGVILGTAAYMSPEQARGRPADKRSDIWAFGCVLYEMLTGKRPFGGDDISETLALVITKDPDWSALPADTPPNVRQLIRRCIEKNRHERIPDIGVARLEINDALKAPAVSPAIVLPSRATRPRLAWSIAAVSVVVALASAAFAYFGRSPADAAPIRFFVALPSGTSLTRAAASTSAPGATPSPVTISPDGRRLGILVNGSNGRSRLWVRSLDALVGQELPGTEGASGPFWSPDSQFLGFFADGRLKKIDVTGGSPVTLCEAADYRGAAWGAGGVILFAPSARSGLMKVSAAGGVATNATAVAPGEGGHARPSFLPDGRHFFYRAYGSGIFVGSLDSGERTLLFADPDSSTVVYTAGLLLFIRGKTLMAQPFDPKRLALTGEPAPVAEQIQLGGVPASALFAVSDTGVLVYQTGAADVGSRLVWMDRSGKKIGVLGDRAGSSDVQLSPDGKRVAMSVAERNTSVALWLFDVARELRTRLTSPDRGADQAPVWAPDGGRIGFVSNRKGHYDLYQRAISGAGDDEPLLVDQNDKWPTSWSPDGRFILYGARAAGSGNSDLWILPTSGDRKPAPLVQTRFNEIAGQFSPDGRFVAYQSDDSGRNEVYVAPFPGPGSRTQVSTAGGIQPRWRRDGRELLFFTPDSYTLTAAAITIRENTLDVGRVQPLFSVVPGGQRYFYDVAPDGQRFLVNTSDVDDQRAVQPLTVVVNWMTGLKK
jgi:serine/threonine protein kinase/Tol biopolymer transport system component